VPAAEKTDLLNILGPLKSQIVEDNSTNTGTALPPSFKPAKPLPKKTLDAGPANKTAKPAKSSNSNSHM